MVVVTFFSKFSFNTVVIHFIPGTFHFLTEPGIFCCACLISIIENWSRRKGIGNIYDAEFFLFLHSCNGISCTLTAKEMDINKSMERL